MIYVDELQRYETGLWCHMWTDDTDEALDRFASRIGLKIEWAQNKQGVFARFYHYDLKPSKRLLALQYGAIERSLKSWVIEQIANRIEQDNDE